MHSLGAQRPDLARRVATLERREIHHPDREVERPELGGLLDRPFAQRLDTLLDADLVDRGDTAQQAAEMSGPVVPGPDELVGALAGRRVGTADCGHGTVRIQLPPATAGKKAGTTRRHAAATIERR